AASWLAAGAVDGSHGGAGIARLPAAGLDLMEKILQQLVEERRLLEVDAVSAFRQHGERGRRGAALDQDARLDAGLVLVAGHDEEWHLQSGELARHVIEGRPARLHAEQRVRRAERRMLVELAHELVEAAR